MKTKLTLDRFEGELGVCIDECGNKYDLPKSLLKGLSESDIFLATREGNSFSEIEPLREETERKTAEIKDRLHRLFNKNKN